MHKSIKNIFSIITLALVIGFTSNNLVVASAAEVEAIDILELTLTDGTVEEGAYTGQYIAELYINGDLTSAKKAFNNATIGKLTISENVTMIPDYMFYNTTINSISFADSVKTVGDYAFYNSTLPATDFDVSDAIKTIGNYAFYSINTTIDTLELSDVSVGTEAFSYTTIDNVILSNDNVTSKGIFGNTTINNLSITDGVTAIPDNLFHGTYYDVTIGNCTVADTVKTIGISAFNNVIFTGEFALPEGVKSIGKSAFYGTTLPEGFVIPSTVKRIDAKAFQSLTNPLKVVRLNDITLGSDAFLYTTINELVLESSDVSVDKSFSKTSIQKFEVLDGVTEIPDTMFYGIYGDTTIGQCIIPNSVTKIGNSAFRNVVVTDIVIPESVKEIGGYAFYDAELPMDFVIPDTVEKISGVAFYSVENPLTELVLSNVEVGADAFAYTTINNLTLADDSVTTTKSFSYTTIRNFEVLDNVTVIPDTMFYGIYGNTKIDTILLHDNIRKIGEYAFAKTTIIDDLVLNANIQEIGKNAFYQAEVSFKSADLRNASVGANAFMAATLKECNADASVINSAGLSGANINKLYIEYGYLDKVTKNVFKAYPAGSIKNIIFSGIESEWTSFINGYETGTQIADAVVECVGTEALEPDNILVLEGDGKYHYHVGGVTDTTKNGLIFHDNVWIYLEEGIWIQDKYEFINYDGGTFLIANGALAQLSGLVQYGNDFYFLSDGQLQKNYTGLAMYDGEWFYVINGVLASGFKGILDYDGSKFLVADGRLLNSYSGLFQNTDGVWYFISLGQVQTQYTGLAQYDGAWFYVVNGVLAVDYVGNVQYDGAVFNVVAGMVVS